MIGIPLGLITANGVEWLMHKYALHGLGRNRNSFWAFHWHDHHRSVRKNDFYDEGYEHSPLQWNPHSKEILSLAAGAAVVTPLLPLAPFYVGTLYYCAWNYYRVHKKSHQDPEWAKQHLPWHYDHHMGPNPNANWCVTKPWFDHIMGTREKYVGTELEAKQLNQRTKRSRSKNATTQAGTPVKPVTAAIAPAPEPEYDS